MQEIYTPAKEVQAILRRMARKLLGTFPNWDDVVFIGVRRGGEYLAQHLAGLVEHATGTNMKLGALDIALYRDDLSKRINYPEVRRTEVPFDINGKIVILIDDVLKTGRTVRAAIDHMLDLGRPRRIYLLVLFDRGGRELPIAPDFTGKTVHIPPEKILKINILENERHLGDVVLIEAGQ